MEEVTILAEVEEPTVQSLERRLAEIEGQIQNLLASATAKEESTGRKTVQSFGVSTKLAEGVSASAMDDALGSLSVEQRIAVKMEMMRRGWIG